MRPAMMTGALTAFFSSAQSGARYPRPSGELAHRRREQGTVGAGGGRKIGYALGLQHAGPGQGLAQIDAFLQPFAQHETPAQRETGGQA